jgi:hypothetical protein
MQPVSPYRSSRLAVILFSGALMILSGNAALAMNLNSPAFQQDGHIPSKYTCEGADISPPLAWDDLAIVKTIRANTFLESGREIRLKSWRTLDGTKHRPRDRLEGKGFCRLMDAFT